VQSGVGVFHFLGARPPRGRGKCGLDGGVATVQPTFSPFRSPGACPASWNTAISRSFLRLKALWMTYTTDTGRAEEEGLECPS
jgi:hypothetical protein